MKNRLAVFASLCALFVLTTASRQGMAFCRDGLRLCTGLILPSLFPFFVVSGLLSNLGFPQWFGRKLEPAARKLFGVSGVGASALAIGLCGGYPMGAAYLAGMLHTGQINAEECSRLLAFCNNTGPAFLIGAVGGGVFGNPRLGVLLYAVHSLSAVLTGLLLRRRAADPSVLSDAASKPEAMPFSAAFSSSVHRAVEALLGVCAFVVCFTVFIGLLRTNGWIDALEMLFCERFSCDRVALRALFSGFFELGSGVSELCGQRSSALYPALASAIVGWGGLSVHFQTLSLFSADDIKSAPHTAGRLLSAVFSFFLTYILLALKN